MPECDRKSFFRDLEILRQRVSYYELEVEGIDSVPEPQIDRTYRMRSYWSKCWPSQIFMEIGPTDTHERWLDLDLPISTLGFRDFLHSKILNAVVSCCPHVDLLCNYLDSVLRIGCCIAVGDSKICPRDACILREW